MATTSMNFEATMEVVFKNIYSSCDLEETNGVPAAKLIEYISPYLMEDEIAFESLKSDLDPNNENVPITSERFYEIMNTWAKKISDSNVDNEFSTTPSQIDESEDKDFAFVQSTPRASFGHKLLSCEELLNLSNLTLNDSTSISRLNDDGTVGLNKQILEEEVKRLEHQLKQAMAEMAMMKSQIDTTEEHNESLQKELTICRTRLLHEQQMIEHLQKEKFNIEELREEINYKSTEIDKLTIKLHQNEKDTSYMSSLIKQLESENFKYAQQCDEFSKKEQLFKREIFDIKTELESKEQELVMMTKLNEEFKQKLVQEEKIIVDLTEENGLLDYKRNKLERRLSNRRSYSFSPIHISKVNNSMQDHSYEEDISFDLNTPNRSSNQISLHTELCQAKQVDTNEKEEEEWVTEDLINSLTIENESFKEQLSVLTCKNKELQSQYDEANIKIGTLFKELEEKNKEKQNYEDQVKRVENEKRYLENQIKSMEDIHPQLLDKNQELQKNLTKIKNDYYNLQIQYKMLENEMEILNNKFSFEDTFKNLQIELCQKNSELQKLTNSCIEYKEIIKELTHSNCYLEQELSMMSEAQYRTANSQQLSKTTEDLISSKERIQYLEKELQQKLSDIANLISLQKDDMCIKNKMWKNYRDLETSTNSLKEELIESENSVKQLKEEHNKLQTIYNDEVTRNSELCEQIRKQKEDLCEALTKFQQENDKNVHLSQQIEKLKTEISAVKENQLTFNEQTREKLSNYEAMWEKYDNKHKELEIMNNSLQQKLSEYETIIKQKEETIIQLKSTLDSLKDGSKSEKNLSGRSDIGNRPDTKSRSFEKQQLIIDKLRCKVKELGEELQKEKSKNVLEKQTDVSTVKDHTEKNKSQQEYYNVIDNVSEEKIKKLSGVLNQIEEANLKLKLELDGKDNLLKQQLEIIENNMVTNHQLSKTITELNRELSKRQDEITSCTEENEILKNKFANSEKKIQELCLRVFELEREFNVKREEVEFLSRCMQEKDRTIQNLKVNVSELDFRISGLMMEISEKNNEFDMLLKEKEHIQERLFKTDDRKELELINLEEKIKNTRKVLKDLKSEIKAKSKLLNSTGRKYQDTARLFFDETDFIQNYNPKLFRAISAVLKGWQAELQKDSRFKSLPALETDICEPEDSLFSFTERISVAVVLLEILATKPPMANSTILNAVSDSKQVKKFTLRPAKLMVGRPVSPDSPSFDFDEGCGDISKSSKITDSPDSRTTDPNNESTDISDDVSVEDTFNSSVLFSPLALSFEDAFPNLTDTFLEKIGLNGDDTKETLSMPETERVFATFAVQIAVDSVDIKQRLEQQREVCEKQHKRLLTLMKDISVRVRNHRCIGALDSIKPVFVLLEDVRYLLREIMQTSGQFGILSCEHRMMKCWNMITNYMALLKKEANLSPTKRKQIDKQVETDNLQESMFENITDSKKFDDQPQKLIVKEPTDDWNEYSGRGIFSWCTELAKYLALILLLIFIGLVSIHLQCQRSTESQMCPLDIFIQKIHLGTPPH